MLTREVQAPMALRCIVTLRTLGGSYLFCTGKAGQAWLSEIEADAFQFGEGEAQAFAERSNRQYESVGLRFMVADLAPRRGTRIADASAPMALYLQADGSIRSVPSESARLAGYRESYYGDREHLRMLIELGEFQHLDTFTEAGLEFMGGLTCNLDGCRLTFRT